MTEPDEIDERMTRLEGEVLARQDAAARVPGGADRDEARKSVAMLSQGRTRIIELLTRHLGEREAGNP
jgi:hypothetical protein